jgi:acetyl esterase/lipase
MLREQARLARIRPVAPPRLLFRVGRWWTRTVLRESAPQLAVAGLVVIGVLLLLGAAGATLGVVAMALFALIVLLEVRHAWLAHRSTTRIEEALEGIEGPEDGPKVPRSHLVVPPLAFVTRGVIRERGVKFAEVEGKRLRLDIYRPADHDPDDDSPQPAVIQVHGGGWLAGSRFEQGIPLLNHLASIGWVGFNIDYRLSPQATFPDQITDVKRAIAWVRENAEELGIDPEMICLTGGSAGGHLTALAALTPGDFQPGFEDADTSVAAAVPFYGVFDLTDSNGFYYPELRSYVFEKIVFKRSYAGNEDLYRAASPTQRVHADAPPFLIIHGERDTLVPVEDARHFAEELKRVSREPVRYVELPGAEHAFDLWPSERTARISEGIGRFLTAIAEALPRQGASRPRRLRRRSQGSPVQGEARRGQAARQGPRRRQGLLAGDGGAEVRRLLRQDPRDLRRGRGVRGGSLPEGEVGRGRGRLADRTWCPDGV